MASIVRNEVIDPKTLGKAEREALVDGLYAVHAEIFDGVSREEFVRYVIDSPAETTKIQLSYGEKGDLAGYIAMHAFRRSLGDEACLILRAEAGLRRAYRGNASSAGFFLSNLLKSQWEHSGPKFYLGCLVHPSSYTILAHGAATVYPAAGEEIPDEVMDLMMKLGDEFHLEMVDASRPLVRRVGWITRDTEAERRYWQTTDAPAARYFIEQNPEYWRGNGLLTLFPLDGTTLAKSVVNWASSRLKKNIQRTVGTLERGVLRRQLDATTAEELLATVERMTGLDLDSVRKQGLLGTRFPLTARSVLFRAGERADAMYAVLEGSLFVLDDNNAAEEVVIDQLGPNTLVGEMAMMTGQPRSATVRAAVDTVLLRLSKEDVQALHKAEPRLEAELWRQIHGRVFGLEIRRIALLKNTTRDEQERWHAAGTAYHLQETEGLDVSPQSVLVLSLGKVLVEQEGVWMSIAAPSLVQITTKARLTSITEARFSVLPGEPPSGA